MILGVDRLLDMLRTAVNITGDSTISCILHITIKKIKLKRLFRPTHPEQNYFPMAMIQIKSKDKDAETILLLAKHTFEALSEKSAKEAEGGGRRGSSR
jgi:hypothetical protein